MVKIGTFILQLSLKTKNENVKMSDVKLLREKLSLKIENVKLSKL